MLVYSKEYAFEILLSTVHCPLANSVLFPTFGAWIGKLICVSNKLTSSLNLVTVGKAIVKNFATVEHACT
jgi:hypothetical protein